MVFENLLDTVLYTFGVAKFYVFIEVEIESEVSRCGFFFFEVNNLQFVI